MFRVSFRSEQMISDGPDQDVYKRLMFLSLVVVILIDRSIKHTSTVMSPQMSFPLNVFPSQCLFLSKSTEIRHARMDQKWERGNLLDLRDVTLSRGLRVPDWNDVRRDSGKRTGKRIQIWNGYLVRIDSEDN